MGRRIRIWYASQSGGDGSVNTRIFTNQKDADDYDQGVDPKTGEVPKWHEGWGEPSTTSEVINVDDFEAIDICKETDGLIDAKPDCDGEVVAAIGGGIKCKKCGGWFCY